MSCHVMSESWIFNKHNIVLIIYMSAETGISIICIERTSNSNRPFVDLRLAIAMVDDDPT